MDNYIVVIGGANIDIGGLSFSPLIMGDSNPGEIRTALGGVGRNIAHNLALLGANVRLITVLGGDHGAADIEASCASLGIDLSDALRVPQAATSTYLFISDPDGNMALAMNDMTIYNYLTPAFLAEKLSMLNRAALVILDANIPQECIEFVAHRCTAPIYVDPVSASKAVKCAGSLGYFHTLKPNRLEAELLSGVSITDEACLEQAADALLKSGLSRVFISLGADGVYAASRTQRLRLPVVPSRSVNATGCGDAFTAALACAALDGCDLEASARFGLAAAAIAAESAETINPAMSGELIKARLETF